MSVNPSEQSFTPVQAAKLVGTAGHNIRRWCEWHAAHLSEGANPGHDKPRRLTARDIEVLKAVKNMRNNGLQTPTINEQLAGLTFAVVDTESPPTLTAPLQAAQEATSTALQVVQALSTVLSPLEARINRLEAKRFDVQSFAFGVIVGLLFVLVFIGLAWAVMR